MEKKKNDDFFETIEWLVFENYYEKPNLLKEIDFLRYEDIHTNFLTNLLKKDNIYHLETFPIKQLLHILDKKEKLSFDIDSSKIDIIRIEKQFTLYNKKRKYIDIFIELKVNNEEEKEKNYSCYWIKII